MSPIALSAPALRHRRSALVLSLLLAVAMAVGAFPGASPPASAAEPATGQGSAAATQASAGERLAGPDRVATAVALSRRGWNRSDTVVLVRADAFADALPGGMLADHLGAPLLLTAGNALSPAAEAEVRRLGARRAIVVGGSVVVGGAVADRLTAIGARVERVAGSDRFATAAAVSRAIDATPPVPGVGDLDAEPQRTIVARGAHADPVKAWPDALSGGAFAVLDTPTSLLLTADHLPQATRDRVTRIGRPVTVLGGHPAVPEAQIRELSGLVRTVHRHYGADRYATSRAVADAVLERLAPTPRPLVVASGANYPDALAAAPLAGRLGGLLLLVPPTGFSPDGQMAAWLRGNRARFGSLIAVGGANVLPDAALAQIAAATGTQAPPPSPSRIALPAFGQMGPGWQKAFSIGYGPAEAQLGTSPGGEGLMLGPEAAAQAPDGSWWVLDGAKKRVARYDAAGRYLGQVVLGPEVLRQGEYMPYAEPRVLDDGTFYAFSLQPSGTRTDVLRIRDGRASLVVLPSGVVPVADDGVHLYGITTRGPVLVDVDQRTVSPVPAMRGRNGQPFSVTVGRGELRYTRPGQARSIPVVGAQAPGGPAGYAAQVSTDEDGTIHLFLMGVDTRNEQQGIGGYTAIRPDGSIAPVVSMRTPYNPANAWSTGRSNLGVRPGTNEVSVFYVEPDGLHVYRRG